MLSELGELHRAMLTAVSGSASCGDVAAGSILSAWIPNRLIRREELVPALFALHDILEEVRKIRRLLEDDDGEEVQEDPEE